MHFIFLFSPFLPYSTWEGHKNPFTVLDAFVLIAIGHDSNYNKCIDIERLGNLFIYLYFVS